MRLMPRFSLRTAAVLLTLLCLVSALFAIWRRQAIDQQRAIAAIESAGGWVKIEENKSCSWLRERLGRHYFDRVTFASVPADFVWIRRLPRLRELELTGSFDDSEVVNLLGNRHLRRVAIHGPQVSSHGLEVLCQIKSLQSIEISGSKLTRKDLVFFQRLPRLQRLSLAYTELDDSALPALGPLPLLEELSLQGCPIDGTGFAELTSPQALPRLKNLNLDSTLLSRAGLHAVISGFELEELNLSRTAVDDECLKELAPAESLSELDLSHTKITNIGLPHIFALPALKSLDVTSTRVTLPSISSEGEGTALSGVGIDYRQLDSEASVDEFFELQPRARLLILDQPREIDSDAWHQLGNASRTGVLSMLRLHQETLEIWRKVQPELLNQNAQE